MHKIKTAIIGGSGYTGQELLRYLQFHKYFQLIGLSSDQHDGSSIGEVLPIFQKSFADLKFERHQAVVDSEAELFFLATPNDVSLRLVPELYERNVKIVDLSGSFRLANKERFEHFYGLDHPGEEWISKRVYGIPDIDSDRVSGQKFISNPGCYATASLIPLYGIHEVLDQLAAPIMIDAKSGVSGAGGRVSSPGMGYVDVNENFKAYKILSHQHEPEILEHLQIYAEKQLSLSFVPHLLPMSRGILVTIWLYFKDDQNENHLRQLLHRHYQDKYFIHLADPGVQVQTAHVSYTNQCHLQLTLKEDKRTVVLTSVIDNLGKGAAGQAIQNANLMLGINETEGLN